MVRIVSVAMLLAVAAAGLSACGHKAQPVADNAAADSADQGAKKAKRVKNVYHK